MLMHHQSKGHTREGARETNKENNKDSLRDKKDPKVFFHLAETFQALGDSSRVQIVWALMQRESTVGGLVSLLGMSQPAISHHLRTLRNLRLVRRQKMGRHVVYALDDAHINRLMEEGLKHVEDLL